MQYEINSKNPPEIRLRANSPRGQVLGTRILMQQETWNLPRQRCYRFLGSFGFRDERKLLIVVTVFTLGRCKPVARSGGGTL